MQGCTHHHRGRDLSEAQPQGCTAPSQLQPQVGPHQAGLGQGLGRAVVGGPLLWELASLQGQPSLAWHICTGAQRVSACNGVEACCGGTQRD